MTASCNITVAAVNFVPFNFRMEISTETPSLDASESTDPATALSPMLVSYPLVSFSISVTCPVQVSPA